MFVGRKEELNVLSVRSALVYDGELAPELEENNYFGFLVPAARLFD